MPFKIGDVVQLKSGGPAMTVVETGANPTCAWYADEDESFRRDTFPEACLDVIDFEDDEAEDEEDEDDED